MVPVPWTLPRRLTIDREREGDRFPDGGGFEERALDPPVRGLPDAEHPGHGRRDTWRITVEFEPAQAGRQAGTG